MSQNTKIADLRCYYRKSKQNALSVAAKSGPSFMESINKTNLLAVVDFVLDYLQSSFCVTIARLNCLLIVVCSNQT